MKQVTLHKQETDYSCGPASLKMVLGYFGVEKTEAELINPNSELLSDEWGTFHSVYGYLQSNQSSP